jgi:hypothetical protein
MSEFFRFCGMSLPVYHVDDGENTGTMYLSGWLYLLLFFIIIINIFGWGVYGIVELVDKVI